MTQLTVLGYGAVIAAYLMNQEVYSHFVLYENLMKNVQEQTKTLFEDIISYFMTIFEAIFCLKLDPSFRSVIITSVLALLPLLLIKSRRLHYPVQRILYYLINYHLKL